MNTSRPLVTFALFTYNQEAYVAEAVGGALSQDYSPLEVIISDDASTDRTFEIIQGLVRDYRGPHDIRLVRNEVNLGIGAHVTKVANLARGELIVAAAGDDISLPGRSAAMVQIWEGHKRKPDLLGCGADRIDSEGRSIGPIRANRFVPNESLEIVRTNRLVVGATAAWTKRLWNLNPELPPDCVFEDHVMTLRAAMSGGIAMIPEQLVKYRIGTGISSIPHQADGDTLREHRTRWIERRLRALSIQMDDARRHDREDLLYHLNRYDRELSLVHSIYRTGRLPAMRALRGALGIRSCRMALLAIAATKIPQTLRRARGIQERLRHLACWPPSLPYR